ncbi:MAG: heavy metal-binding domain-containing protein [Paludibacteraceae bacterium]|nr:heavy metal-binding domain-containing protein [Paludibacteraceae bacterium]
MKKVVLFLALAAFLVAGTTACSGGKKAEAKTSETKTAVIYTCPMHPEVQSDKPGKCPKCGMDLVEKK